MNILTHSDEFVGLKKTTEKIDEGVTRKIYDVN